MLDSASLSLLPQRDTFTVLLTSRSRSWHDGPTQDTEHRLGNEVRDGVADLLIAACRGTADAHHLDDVDTWVCEPGDDCQVAGLHEESTDTLRVRLGGSSQANHKGLHHKGEWAHGHGPEDPAGGIVVLDLARIADGNHESRGNSKLPCQVLSLLHWQSHDQDQLDQKQRDSQEPVNVSVGIVEGCTRQSHGVV